MLLRSSLARLAVARGRLAAARFCTAAEETAYPTPQEVWEGIQGEARAELQQARGDDFGLPSYLKASVLAHDTLASGLSRTVGSKLAANKAEDSVDYESIITSALEADPSILGAVTADLCRFKVVDPATTGLLGVFLFYKGVQALAYARVAHHYWTERGGQGKLLARLLQSEMADVYGVDIHPGCTLGSGITIDHATGVTLGETCVIGDNVYIMHDVTLGATGNSSDFDRHPKVAKDVFLGAKCTVLGNIKIGCGATIAAAALVNKPVPAGYTAVGVPARLVAPKQPIDLKNAK